MSQTSIRHATALDAGGIARVHRQSWKAAHSDLVAPNKLAKLTDDEWDRLWRQRLSAQETIGSTLVAEHDGHILALAFWRPGQDEDLDPTRVAELTALYVLPSRWRAGIGASLLQATLHEMRDGGFREAVLWVLEGNERAVSFYEATGWAREKRVDEFKDFGAAALRYRTSL